MALAWWSLTPNQNDYVVKELDVEEKEEEDGCEEFIRTMHHRMSEMEFILDTCLGGSFVYEEQEDIQLRKLRIMIEIVKENLLVTDMEQKWSKLKEQFSKQILGRLLELQIIKLRFLRCLVRLSHYLNGQSGTSSSLLLDGWWLEFWEIVLLAAGDVESNPGPNQISDEQLAKVDNGVLGIDHLPCVLDSVIKCHEKWFNLCLALYVPYSKLAGIEMSHHDPTTCLREGLAVWLKGDYSEDQHGPPSWRKLVAAVDKPSGGNHTALALEIAKNHMCEVGDAFKSSSPSQSVHCDSSHLKKGKKMSSAFSRLYRSLRRELRVDVKKVKEFIRYKSKPHSLHERCVPLRVYEGATSTKDLLDKLYPTYINPLDTFLLEEIIKKYGSRTPRCKRLLREYKKKFF